MISSPSILAKHQTRRYDNFGEIICEAAKIFQPSERLTTTEAAEKYVFIEQPGQYTGHFKNDKTPYMREPADNLRSRYFTSEVFCGPAQCGKTQSLIINWVGASVMTQPMDMIIYSPTQANARDFSTRRIDRLHDKSPVPGEKSAIGKKLLKQRDADNKTDKRYESGMILTLSWPTKNELAGKPVGLIALTDYDRIADDIDGDGDAFSLASKRTTTFKSFGMTLAESSPSRPIENLKWVRKTPHEAPPCVGILGLYNQGDRRRWYWPCPHCGNYFVGSFEMLEWDATIENPKLASRTARMRCPTASCSELIHPDSRYKMNLAGMWLADGQSVDRNGVVRGTPEASDMCSYWLDGTAAAFITWPQLVKNKIEAERDYERTGSEEKLRKFYNNDLAQPYRPKATEQSRTPELIMNRAETFGTVDEPVVPEGVRFLVATIDVQKSMFVVQVHGIGPGEPFDTTVIDRYQIRLNDVGRTDNEGQIAWVKPGIYLDDWKQIVPKVMEKTYPLADESGRRMAIKITGCDSGGKEGVTAKAYEFYRWLRREGLSSRFWLVKGGSTPNMPRTSIIYPDANDSGNKAAARGDIPILYIHTNELKDMLNMRLDALIPGKGMIRFPDWLPDWFFAELCAENRVDGKGWKNERKERNEAWDLLCYALALCVSSILGVETYQWSNPPVWGREWDTNPLVIAPEAKKVFARDDEHDVDFAALARKLA